MSNKNILIEINISDLCNIIHYNDFILNEIINYDINIPYKLQNDYSESFNKINTIYNNYIFKKIKFCELVDFINSDMMIRFDLNKSYNFYDKLCSFKLLMIHVFKLINSDAFFMSIKIDNDDKRIIIKKINDSINEYFILSNNEIQSNFFGKYKRYVLVGYIIWRLGFFMSQKLTIKSLNGNQPTNQMLYESIKYHL